MNGAIGNSDNTRHVTISTQEASLVRPLTPQEIQASPALSLMQGNQSQGSDFIGRLVATAQPGPVDPTVFSGLDSASLDKDVLYVSNDGTNRLLDATGVPFHGLRVKQEGDGEAIVVDRRGKPVSTERLKQLLDQYQRLNLTNPHPEPIEMTLSLPPLRR